MREIKFRAWQKNHKKLSLTPMVEWENGKIKLIRFDNGVNCCPRYSTYGLKEWPLDCLELMQYTGLKDKNGVEIYEGDIVHTKQYGIPVQRVVRIDRDGVFPFSYKNIEWGGHDGEWDSEVIGNIYENPELLNK